jgi:hypothetical protein
MFAYDANDNLVDSFITNAIPKLGKATMTVEADNIAYVLVGGLNAGPNEDSIGLDNLRYEVCPLKHEIVVGEDLMFGNYYAGAVHGRKLQIDGSTPAPNIPVQLVDQNGNIVRVDANGRVTPGGAFDHVRTNAQGHYWFLDVDPGFYVIREIGSPAVLTNPLPTAPINVAHATVHHASGVPAMPYPGLQTTAVASQLTMFNEIEGSIHGLVRNQSGAPVAGQVVELRNLDGTVIATDTTDSSGEYEFDVVRGSYAVSLGNQLRLVTISSGEEEVGVTGLATPLDPGQYETPNPNLNFTVNVQTAAGPRVVEVKAGSTQWTTAFKNIIDPGTGIGYAIPGGSAQLDTLPWINIDRLFVKFSEDVGAVAASDVQLVGVNVANYAKSTSYNASTHVLTISLNTPLQADKLILHIDDEVDNAGGNRLDGEWNNGAMNYPSGNGSAGGDFNFRINVLPGDVTGDGWVAGNDVIQARNAQFPLPYNNPRFDVNGDAFIVGHDVTNVRNAQTPPLNSLHLIGDPVAPAAGASLLGFGEGSGSSLDDSSVIDDESSSQAAANDSALDLLYNESEDEDNDADATSLAGDDESEEEIALAVGSALESLFG